MKKILLLFGLAFASQSFAQDMQLLDNTWYIHKLVKEGEEIFVPHDDENVSTTLTVYPNEGGQYIFATGFCAVFGAQVWFQGDNVFTLQDGPGFTIGTCNNESESALFSGHYIGIFYPTGNASNPFTYTITNGTGSNKLLVITNPDGDSAYYGNFMLSAPEFKDTGFTIYPNPVVKELNIQANMPIAVVKVYTADGREVITEKLLPELAKVNVETLEKGIYILQLITKDNISYNSKFIKE